MVEGASPISTNSATRSSGLKGLISRRPLLTYFVLSYGFFWLVIAVFAGIVGALGLRPAAVPSWAMTLVVIVGSWMPALAAVLVTASFEGRAGIRSLFAKWLHFRLPIRWYLAALIPLGLAFVAAALYRLAGGSESGIPVTLGTVLALILISVLQGPTGEELGWRGFALPRMLKSQNPLKAAIVLGLLWDGWHLPLWVASGYTSLSLLQYCLVFTVGIVSTSVLMTWIYCRTSSSLVPMTLVHLSLNMGFALMGVGTVSNSTALTLLTIMFSLLLTAAIVVWLLGGLSTGTRHNSWQDRSPDSRTSAAVGSNQGV